MIYFNKDNHKIYKYWIKSITTVEGNFLAERGIVFAYSGEIYALHKDSDTPFLIATRDHPVTSLFFRWKLYDGGLDGRVRDTVNGKVLGVQPEINPMLNELETESSAEDDKDFFEQSVFGINSINGRLVVAYQDQSLWTMYSADTPQVRDGVRISYLDNGEDIVRLGEPINGDLKRIDLDVGPGRPVDFTIADGKLYASSENVVEVEIDNGGTPKVKRLTDYTADDVMLASNGRYALSIAYQNEHHQPGGPEIRSLPQNIRWAYWDEDKYKSPAMATLDGHTLLVGLADSKSLDISAIDISHRSVIGVEPQPIFNNAIRSRVRDLKGTKYEGQYVGDEMPESVILGVIGNPMTTVPNRTLERIIERTR